MKTLATLALLLAIASPAFADSGLYVNTDNKGWKLVRLFAFPEECDREARSLYRSGKVIGAGCADVGAIVDTRPSQPQQPAAQWNPTPTPEQPSTPSSRPTYNEAKQANEERRRRANEAFEQSQREYRERMKAAEAFREDARSAVGLPTCHANPLLPGCGPITIIPGK